MTLRNPARPVRGRRPPAWPTTPEGRHTGLPQSAEAVIPEAAANGPDDGYELVWAAAGEFGRLNLHPADVREPLTRLPEPAGRATGTPLPEAPPR